MYCNLTSTEFSYLIIQASLEGNFPYSVSSFSWKCTGRRLLWCDVSHMLEWYL